MPEPVKQGHWPFYELRAYQARYPEDDPARLRTSGCIHPKTDRAVAFVSPEAAEKLWSKRDMKFNEDIPVEIDPNIKTGQIHFPQGDGTCWAPNV